jgi:uncharacterized repeat protein (TIGR01451 family)
LMPGESFFVSIAGQIPDTGLISNAIAQGDPSDDDGNVLTGVPSPQDQDDAEVREASIKIETTVAAGADANCDDAVEVLLIPLGEDITWCFAVTNTGVIDLQVLQVTDTNLDVTAPIPADEQRLAAGATVFVQANDVAEGPVEIDADVKGKPLDADGSLLAAPEVEDVDPARIVIPVVVTDVPEADLAIVKTVSNSGPVAAGTQLTYTLEVTNNGPDTATGVVVIDQLPSGISYVALPGDADWACALSTDSTGFSCLKATDMANGDSVTLSYTARIDITARLNGSFTNVAEVSSETPDTDPTNNEDNATTSTPRPGEQQEYPGPFPTPTPIPTPVPVPDEVLGLAITGSSSNLLGLISAAMLAVGGLLMVGARRGRDD